MYKGKRDAHVSIRVPMELCYLVQTMSGPFVEILVPPYNHNSKPINEWASFMVMEEQVCFMDEHYNKIEQVNAYTAIRLCQHYNDANGVRRAIPDTNVYLNPHEIMCNMEHYIYDKAK